MPTRRDMLKAAVGTVASLSLSPAIAEAFEAPIVAKGSTSLAKGAFETLPLGEIAPTGWLLRQLRLQADGLGGHLDEFWPDVGPNSGWLGGTGESWERGPYFLDGLLPLAYQLNDPVLKAKAQRFVDWTLDNQAPNGMIGPATNDDWWPRMVMVKALAQYFEVSHDPRVLPALTKYFHHQLAELPLRPLAEWGKFRWQDEVLVVEWLYDRTQDAKLLELAALLKNQGFDWTGSFSNFDIKAPVTRAVLVERPGGFEHGELAMRAHGVNNGQALKTAAVQFRLSGNSGEKKNYDLQLAALDEFHGLPNGMFSCDEHLAGTDPSHGTELCTVVETMFSMEVALATFGDPAIADRIEKVAYNALPGTFTDDMWAHQYDQQSNQVQSSLNSKPWTTNGPESNLFGLEPHFGCCTANFHQGWPKLTANLWMKTHDDGLAAVIYAPCEVRTTVRGVKMMLTETTEYPFKEKIQITVRPEQSVRFPLSIRVPAWAAGAAVRVNGKAVETVPKPGSFVAIDRTWASGDRVDVTLPMRPRMSRWFHNSIALERGPLVFSFDPGESWVKLRDRGMTADWQVFPTGSWNYALAVDESSVEGVSVEERAVPAQPFSGAAAAVEIKVPAARLAGWRSEDGVANPLPVSPVTSDEPVEHIRLVPYASAKLRITAFPQMASKTHS